MFFQGQNRLESLPVLLGEAGGNEQKKDFIECSVCGKKCSGRNRNQILDRHMETHSNHRPVPCPYCPHRSINHSQLSRHLSISHSSLGLPHNSHNQF
ncbi:hypothetical protein Avbf_00238 [Armadillidium vulgare]|nr:hypothetical protein Avbf_00238 [Armadillidium vulgare]